MTLPCNHTARVASCRVCELYATREDYRAVWDSKPDPARGPCLHLGARISGPRRVPCACRYECDAGEPFAVPSGVCRSCPKFEPQTPHEESA
jgi:hypothetical protein